MVKTLQVKLESRLTKIQRVLRKWDNTEEGRLLFETLLENIKYLDSMWHTVNNKEQLDMIRINKCALQMLFDSFPKFKQEADMILKELEDMAQESYKSNLDE